MSEKSPLRAAAGLLMALLLLGCDGAKICQPCGKPEASPQTAKLEVDWHQHSFNFHFEPPWSNVLPRPLFALPVLFQEEAKFEEWEKGSYANCDDGAPAAMHSGSAPQGRASCKNCGDDGAPAAVCPNQCFCEQVLYPFLTELAQCEREAVVELRTIGFASSSGIENAITNGQKRQLLDERHAQHINEVSKFCQGKQDSEQQDPSAMFNLLIANQRAAHVRDMLRKLASMEEFKGKFSIACKPWCSHASMVKGRKIAAGGQGYDPGRSMMNRRVEVHLIELPRCVGDRTTESP